jgi:hypothetical protein
VSGGGFSTLPDAGGAILDRRRTHKMYFKISVIYLTRCRPRLLLDCLNSRIVENQLVAIQITITSLSLKEDAIADDMKCNNLQ